LDRESNYLTLAGERIDVYNCHEGKEMDGSRESKTDLVEIRTSEPISAGYGRDSKKEIIRITSTTDNFNNNAITWSIAGNTVVTFFYRKN